MNQNNKRPERPDKVPFMAMMGVFFLVFAIAPAYWAYYNFGLYGQKTAFVGELQASSEQFLTPNEREKRKDRISSNSSLADRYRLEMLLSAAGSFVLFGIALLLFRTALKARKIKPQYELIDWRAIPMPSSQIEVRQKRIYDVLFAFIAVFFIGMSLLISVQTLTSQFEATTGKVIKGILFPGVLMLVLMAVCYLMFRAKRRTVRFFDASGITRGDGRQFSWNDFCGVVTRIDINFAREKYAWRVELAFADGEAAWIIPHRIKNAEEVFKYVAALPRAFLKAS